MHQHGDALGVDFLICRTPITLPQKRVSRTPDLIPAIAFGLVRFFSTVGKFGSSVEVSKFLREGLGNGPLALAARTTLSNLFGELRFSTGVHGGGGNATVIGWPPPKV